MGESHTERARADRSCGIVATSAGLPNIRLQRCSPKLVGNGPHSTDAKAPAPVTRVHSLRNGPARAPSTERDIRLQGWAPPAEPIRSQVAAEASGARVHVGGAQSEREVARCHHVVQTRAKPHSEVARMS